MFAVTTCRQLLATRYLTTCSWMKLWRCDWREWLNTFAFSVELASLGSDLFMLISPHCHTCFWRTLSRLLVDFTSSGNARCCLRYATRFFQLQRPITSLPCPPSIWWRPRTSWCHARLKLFIEVCCHCSRFAPSRDLWGKISFSSLH